MNTKLVESIISVIQALAPEERAYLAEKLFIDLSQPDPDELAQLAQQGGAFDFLHNEPDLYSIEDGKPIQ